MVAVIAATYNERDNIEILITRLEKVLNDHDYRIIIVDDNSPDGTGQKVKEHQQKNDRLILIERPSKLGLGTALKAGINRALEVDAERIITMDADLSHPPETIVEMLSLDYDIVVGSRYVPGGGVKGWNWTRRLTSSTANYLANRLTGLAVRDTTGSFRCFKREAFDKFDINLVKSEGYSFLIDILWHCQQSGLSIHEIPIIFMNRTRGSSKISTKEIWLAIKTIFRLTLKRIRSGGKE
ncbi:polyprenol monophosphomannose synthase [Patescibacteria group bacterium]